MVIVTATFVLFAVGLWGAFTRFLVYGISLDFGLGVSVGALLMGTLFAIAYRFDHPKPKQEVLPPGRRY